MTDTEDGFDLVRVEGTVTTANSAGPFLTVHTRDDSITVPGASLAGVGAVIDGPAVIRLPEGLTACVATEADWGEVGAERDRYRKALERIASPSCAGVNPDWQAEVERCAHIAREALGPAREETT